MSQDELLANPGRAIPKEVALRLCAEIRAENRARWFSLAHWQCWGCATFTRGDPSKMCLSSQPGYRGCALINARYDREASVAVQETPCRRRDM